MDSVTRNDIPKEEKGRASHFAPLQPDDVASVPRGMYSRAMLRAYAESITVPPPVEEAARATPMDALDEAEQTPVSSAPTPDVPIVPRDPVTIVPYQAPPAVGRRQTGHSRRLVLVASMAVLVGALALGYGLWREATRQPPVVPVGDRRSDIELRAPTAPTPPAVAVQQQAPPVAAPPRPREVRPRLTRASSPPREARAVAPRTLSTDGALAVISEPPGARVTVNGIGWGVTPVTIPYLPFGTKQVRLLKPGYESAERTLTLEPNRPKQSLRVALRPRGVTKAPGNQ